MGLHYTHTHTIKHTISAVSQLALQPCAAQLQLLQSPADLSQLPLQVVSRNACISSYLKSFL